MQVDRMRHHRGADDADGEQQRLRIGDLRHDRMFGRRNPVDRNDEHLDQITKRDDAHHDADDQMHWSEANAWNINRPIGDDAGYDHAGEQRQVKQQRQPDGAAEKLGKVGRHRRDLADDHIPQTTGCGKWSRHISARFAAGDDAELGRQRLEQHRDDVGEQHDPEQAVAVAAPA